MFTFTVHYSSWGVSETRNKAANAVSRLSEVSPATVHYAAYGVREASNNAETLQKVSQTPMLHRLWLISTISTISTGWAFNLVTYLALLGLAQFSDLFENAVNKVVLAGVLGQLLDPSRWKKKEQRHRNKL